jgi:hypothetical protein
VWRCGSKAAFQQRFNWRIRVDLICRDKVGTTKKRGSSSSLKENGRGMRPSPFFEAAEIQPQK